MVAGTSRQPSGSVKECRYGIVLVHGIGFQKKGETLRHLAEALGAWFSCWLTGRARRELAATLDELDGKAGAAVHGSVVDDPDDAEAPARTHLSLRPRGGETVDWLLVESWWAEEFQQPTVLELVSWIALSTPFLLFSHLGTPLVRTWRRLRRPAAGWRKALIWARLLPEAAAVPLAIPLSLLVLAILTVLLLPTLIPVAQVRASTKAFATRVFGLLGDTFIVTMSPVRRDLVVNKVARDIAWLAAKCDAIAIVAHSQGAAIAHDALRRSRPDELRSFITLGSGIQKLLRLRIAFHNGRALVAYAWIAPALAAAGALALALHLAHTSSVNQSITALASAAVAVGLALLGGAVYKLRKTEGYERRLRLDGVGHSFRWVDIYASADPVSNGPTYPTPLAWLDEHEAFIHASILRDHTSYLQDDEGVLPLLAQQFTAGFDGLSFDDVALARARAARWRRRLRTRVLSTARALSAGAAIAAGLQIDTTKLGAATAGRLPDGLRHGLDTLVESLPAAIRGHAAGGICIWLVFSLLAYALFVLAFRIWASRERKIFLIAGDRTAGTERVFFGGLALTLLGAELALASAIAARRSWRVPAWIVVHHPGLLLLIAAVVLAALTLAAGSTRVIGAVTAIEEKLRDLFERQRADPSAASRSKPLS